MRQRMMKRIAVIRGQKNKLKYIKKKLRNNCWFERTGVVVADFVCLASVVTH